MTGRRKHSSLRSLKQRLSTVRTREHQCKENWDEMSEDVVFRAGKELQFAYEMKLLPLEQRHDFQEFYPGPRPDFTSKPLLAVVGCAGSGKTTLVRWLLGHEPYPAGSGAGDAECAAVVFGDGDTVLAGPTALASPHGGPFSCLKDLGGAFLSRFRMVVSGAEPLRSLSLAECRCCSPALPPLMSGADEVLVVVDAGRAADLPPQLLLQLARRRDTVRLLLTKADIVPYAQLLRIYGALMWTLAQVVPGVDPPRVLVVSPGTEWKEDRLTLLRELRQLPRSACSARLGSLTERTILARLHAELTASIGRHISGSGRVTSALVAAEGARLRQAHRSRPFCREDLVAEATSAVQARLLRWDQRHYDSGRLRLAKPGLLLAAEHLLSEDVPRVARLLLLSPEEGIVRGGAFEELDGEEGCGDAVETSEWKQIEQQTLVHSQPDDLSAAGDHGDADAASSDESGLGSCREADISASIQSSEPQSAKTSAPGSPTQRVE